MEIRLLLDTRPARHIHLAHQRPQLLCSQAFERKVIFWCSSVHLHSKWQGNTFSAILQNSFYISPLWPTLVGRTASCIKRKIRSSIFCSISLKRCQILMCWFLGENLTLELQCEIFGRISVHDLCAWISRLILVFKLRTFFFEDHKLDFGATLWKIYQSWSCVHITKKNWFFKLRAIKWQIQKCLFCIQLFCEKTNLPSVCESLFCQIPIPLVAIDLRLKLVVENRTRNRLILNKNICLWKCAINHHLRCSTGSASEEE